MKFPSNIAHGRFLTLLILVFSLSLTTACSRSGEEAASAEAPAPAPTAEAVVAKATPADIPVTTESAAAKALYVEGEYLMDVGRGVQAREKFLAAIAADASFARAYWGQSNVSLSFAEFQQTLDAAVEHSEGISEGERMLIAVNRSFLSNDAAAGLKDAEEMVSKYPDSARAYLVLAGMQANQNDNLGARASNEKALELEAGAPGALFGLAVNNLFGEPKDFAAAEAWIGQFNSAYPDEAKGYEILGDIKRAQNDLEAALAAYNSAFEVDSTLELAAHKRGHINSFLGNIDDARSAYDEAIALAPPESKAGYAVYKGFTNIHGGDVPAAVDELEALAGNVEAMGTPTGQVKGLQVFALNSAGFAAMHAGLMDRAAGIVEQRNALQMAIAEDVGTDDARRLQESNCHFWDGMLAAYRGDAEAAATHAAAIEALLAGDENPRSMEGAHWVLGYSALQAGDYAGAVEHLRQADHANNMFVRYHLAMAEEGNGNADEAIKLYGEVASFNFNSVAFALVGRDAAARAN